MIQPWFETAALGIFIHWGIYAVDGVLESWAFFRGEVTHEEYMKQLSGFTASDYDPGAWVEAIKAAGASYVVISSRHHDGVALYDSKAGGLTVEKDSPAARDLLTPFCQAVREAGLKLGIYYSLSDWNHPDYASIIHEDWGRRYNQGLGPDESGDRFGFCYPPEGEEDEARWESYLSYLFSQLKELQERYDPDLFWFDGDWERSAAQWQAERIISQLRSHNPEVLINSRLCGLGDYATPEQTVPLKPLSVPWEACMTMNDSWGYRPEDTNYKTPSRIIRTFCEIIGKGGNLLLDIAPDARGVLPEEQKEILRELGSWTKEVSKALYTGRMGLDCSHCDYPSTVSRDSMSIYLFLDTLPRQEFPLKGLSSPIESIRLLNGPDAGRDLSFTAEGGASWYSIPPVYWVETRGLEPHPYMTVVEVSLSEPLRLYEGGAQEFGVEHEA